MKIILFVHGRLGRMQSRFMDDAKPYRDIKGGYASGAQTINAQNIYKHHSAVVNDVQFHPFHQFWLGTVSDDLTFQVVDTRSPKKATYVQKAHADAVNTLSWHPKFETLVATGSADSTIGLWDLRQLKDKLHSLEAHKDAVVGLDWHPTNSAVLASSSYDRRILFWDVSKIGEEQSPEEADDGPPEL
jgi:histone-binding protein RBBP4